MNHIMLDLETMGSGPTAAIVAIGACEFDPHSDAVPLNTFYRRVSLESSAACGLTIDTGTILWWMQQSDAARESTFGGEASPLGDACYWFGNWAASGRTPDSIAVWGNGATFDNVIIRSAFKATKLPIPWSFRNDKCYRTVANLLPEGRRPSFIRSGTAHNALDDALTQAKYLQLCFKELGL